MENVHSNLRLQDLRQEEERQKPCLRKSKDEPTATPSMMEHDSTLPTPPENVPSTSTTNACQSNHLKGASPAGNMGKADAPSLAPKSGDSRIQPIAVRTVSIENVTMETDTAERTDPLVATSPTGLDSQAASPSTPSDASSSKAVVRMPAAAESSELVVGAKVRKLFRAGWFDGELTQIVCDEGERDPWYRVVYQDGDGEDLELGEALQLLQNYREYYHRPTSPTSLQADEEPHQEGGNAQVRRSTRTRKSTVIHVNGQTIKKENNYVLKGLTYQHGVLQEDQAKPKSAPKPRATKKSGQLQKQRKAATRADPRMRMKERIAAAVADKQPHRRGLLQRHARTLQPFCEDKVLHAIQNPNGVASSPAELKESFLQPDLITGDMRDYQLQGLNWMAYMYKHNLGMILGDEMGLGKTLQTISLVCHLKESCSAEGPSLVICPMSVLYSWCDEIAKWAPSLKYLRFHSSNSDKMDSSSCMMMDYDIVVTTYEMIKVSALKSLWSRQAFNLVVLDEGHRIKTAGTQTSQAVHRLHAENRIILTGTPVANNLVELWSLLNFLVPDVFTTQEPFAEAFDLTQNTVDPVKLAQAHKVLQVFMLRRLKTEVERLMPKKIETKIVCPLSRIQIWWYKALLLKDISLLARGSSQSQVLNNLIMQLRKVCIHPFLFDGVEDPDETDLEFLVGASGKLSVLDKLLRSLYEKGHRVVLFSQFTRVLDILDDYASMRGWEYCRFDGGTLRAKRNHIVKTFNAPNSNKFLFLMSTRSGGMGLNLQTADTCILFDSDWNPQPDIQAMARVHRIGQKKTVHVYRLVTDGTVEQRMVERAEKKLYLDRMVTRDGAASTEDVAEEEDSEKLMATLKFGCNGVFGRNSNASSLPSDEDIELITDRSRTEDFSQGNLKGNADETAEAFDATKEFTSTTDFGGIDFKQIRDEYAKQKKPSDVAAIKDVWRQEQRQRKSRIKNVEGTGSGYGAKQVPVLASNDYDIETGERSVFQQELKGRGAAPAKKKRSGSKFEAQDFCQKCGDGGQLLCCPRCPVSLHKRCAGVRSAKEFLCCSHHRCTICDKNATDAGGLLFPCSACPLAYCEDHLPDTARVLETNERMEDLGYEIKHGVYVLCSRTCELVAKKKFGWCPTPEFSQLSPRKRLATCPPSMDLSIHFGCEVDDSIEAPDDVMLPEKRRKTETKELALSPQATTNKSHKQAAKPSQTGEENTTKPPHNGEVISVSGNSSDDEIQFLGVAMAS